MKLLIKKFFAYFFNLTHVFGTIVVFMMMYLLGLVVVNLDFLNVFSDVLEDYTVTDVIFSKSSNLRLEPAADTNIVIVNIGKLDRADIAQQIMTLNKYKPRVIGIDSFFGKLREPEQDSLLSLAFSQTENLVLITKVMNPTDRPDGTTVWDSLRTSNPIFHVHADRHGFANTISTGDSQFETWRDVSPKELRTNGEYEYCFAAEIMELYNPEIAKKFKARKNQYEIINYRGNLDKFTVLDVEDVLEEKFDASVVKDKIILMCYLGEAYTQTIWDDDKYYTPMNEKQAGRTTPDMYGGVGHANILSMMLHDDYINPLPEWADWIFAALLCYLNAVIFHYINFSPIWDIWYGILTKILQLFETIFLVYLVLLFFAQYNIKLDLTITIASVLLCGDILEIYFSLFLTLFEKVRNRVLRNSIFGKKA
jgi:CHASE2 domain-containing sensor protein